MNIFVTTQMRTGSTWLCDMLSSIFKTQWIFWEKGRDISKQRFIDQIKKGDKGINIIKMHYTPPERICECIPEGDKNNFVISITRDLRDIIISKIFYMKNDIPMRKLPRLKKLEDMRKEFGNSKLSDKDYVNAFVKSRFVKHIIRNWKKYNNGFKHHNYLLMSYEDLNSKRTLLHIKNLIGFVGRGYINNRFLRSCIVKNNFASRAGRRKGDGSNNSFRRKGIVGDHKNYLTQQSLDRINLLVSDL